MAPLLKYELLIPVLRDSDRRPHSEDAYGMFHHQLLNLAGGYSLDTCATKGVWRDDSGEVIRDTSTRYTVAVSDYPAEDIREIARVACGLFGQQCIYVAFPDGTVELVGQDA